MKRRILVVEDEEMIARSVAIRLEAEGFEVKTAATGPEGVAVCEQFRPDLVVLDLMLPGFDGIEVCRRIQADGPVPVVMLTARDSEADKLIGLGVGADDYMTKPFSPRELVARIHAVLRRSERSVGGEERVRIGQLEIDAAKRTVALSGEPAELTPTEFDLLLHLARRPGVVFSRSELLVDVWKYADGSGERTVDTHIAALRRKLGAGVIRTARGAGYALEEEPTR